MAVREVNLIFGSVGGVGLVLVAVREVNLILRSVEEIDFVLVSVRKVDLALSGPSRRSNLSSWTREGGRPRPRVLWFVEDVDLLLSAVTEIDLLLGPRRRSTLSSGPWRRSTSSTVVAVRDIDLTSFSWA